MSDYQRWSWGGIQFPLPLASASGNTLLRDADPSLAYALDYFAFMIGAYVGARLLADLATANVIGMDQQPVTSAVQTQLPVDPHENATNGQYPLPMLALWRVRSTSEQMTTVHARDNVEWTLLYVLPPLTAAQSERIKPIFRAIEIVLQHATQMGWDPAYTPPGYVPAPGADRHPQSWKLAGLDRIDMQSCVYGDLADMGDGASIRFPAISATFVVKERGTSVQGLSTLQGVDASMSVVPSDGSPAIPINEQFTWVSSPKTGP